MIFNLFFSSALFAQKDEEKFTKKDSLNSFDSIKFDQMRCDGQGGSGIVGAGGCGNDESIAFFAADDKGERPVYFCVNKENIKPSGFYHTSSFYNKGFCYVSLENVRAAFEWSIKEWFKVMDETIEGTFPYSVLKRDYRYTESCSEADITITFNNNLLKGNEVARTSAFVENGSFWAQYATIALTEEGVNWCNSDKLKLVMLHEVGHALGNSDEKGLNEGVMGVKAVHYLLTQRGEIDQDYMSVNGGGSFILPQRIQKTLSGYFGSGGWFYKEKQKTFSLPFTKNNQNYSRALYSVTGRSHLDHPEKVVTKINEFNLREGFIEFQLEIIHYAFFEVGVQDFKDKGIFHYVYNKSLSDYGAGKAINYQVSYDVNNAKVNIVCKVGEDCKKKVEVRFVSSGKFVSVDEGTKTLFDLVVKDNVEYIKGRIDFPIPFDTMLEDYFNDKVKFKVRSLDYIMNNKKEISFDDIDKVYARLMASGIYDHPKEIEGSLSFSNGKAFESLSTIRDVEGFIDNDYSFELSFIDTEGDSKTKFNLFKRPYRPNNEQEFVVEIQ